LPLSLSGEPVCGSAKAKADGEEPSIDATPSAAWPGNPAFLVLAITRLEIRRLLS
jgi:hypothetical protein